MAINISQIFAGGMRDWLERDNLSVQAAEKDRNRRLDEAFELKKQKIAHGYSLKEIDRRNAKDATTNAVDPNFAYANMPQELHKQLEALGVPLYATGEQQAKAYGTGKSASPHKLAYYEQLAGRIKQDIEQDANKGGYHTRLVKALLAEANTTLSGGGMLGGKITEKGAVVDRRLTLGSYNALTYLSTLYKDLPEAGNYTRLFNYGVKTNTEGFGPALLEANNRTRMFDPSIKPQRLKGTIEGSVQWVPTDVDVEGEPTEWPTPKQIAYRVRLGKIPPEVLQTALKGLTEKDYGNLDENHLAVASVDSGSEAEKALQANLIDDVQRNRLASPTVRDAEKTIPSLNWFMHLVLAGKRDFRGALVTTDGLWSSADTDPAPTDRTKYASEAFIASRDLIENLDQAIVLNEDLSKNIDKTGTSLQKITGIQEWVSKFKSVVGALDSSDDNFDSEFSDSVIDRDIGNISDNAAIKQLVDKVRKQRATASTSEDKEYLRLSREYSFMKVRLVFMVAKQLQGRGGRVSDADFRNVAAAFGNSLFGTLPQEQNAFNGLIDMTKKQYAYMFYSQMPRITSLATIEDLADRAVSLEKANKEAVRRRGPKRVMGTGSRKVEESSKVIDALQ